MFGRTDRRLRIVVMLLVFIGIGVTAAARLGYWQVVRGPELQQQTLAQLEQPIQQPAVRGSILDRNGVVLATTAFRDTLSAYPEYMSESDQAVVLSTLTTILGLDAAGQGDLQAKLKSDAPYVVIDRELTDEQDQAVRAAMTASQAGKTNSLGDLVLEPHAVRIYPDPGGAPGTTLASQLLGFVTADGAGRYGIEQQYNTVLAGRPRKVAVLHDAAGRPLESTAEVLDPGMDGQSIRLTIDASLQLQLEKELYAAWVADGSKGVSAVIMDPGSGEILAWASVPGYDANNYAQVATSTPTLLQDPIVSQVYEPGSVMKMFTAAAALGAKVVTPTTIVKDAWSMTFGGQTIHNSDRSSMGKIRFMDAIAYSRNLAVAGVAMRLGPSVAAASAKLYATWQQLGIGKPTGIDVSGEASGIAADPSVHPWQPIDLANRAFGQGVAVTPVQLAVAYAAMSNGGLRVQPHFLLAIGGSNQPSAPPQRVIGAGLAGQLQGLEHHVTASVPWYAAGSLIHGYNVGGKTGTAQVWDAAKGSYSYNLFNFTFCGYVGTSAPGAVIVVHLGETTPKAVRPGDLELPITSYQLFRRIAMDTVSALGIAPSSDPNAGMPEPGSKAEQQLYPALWKKHTSAGGGAAAAPGVTPPDGAPGASGQPTNPGPSPLPGR